ncbi:MAG TPA: DUF6048 family protein [Flavobacteriaceae bacterium]|nr:DUF6048 family protein [Flavobacteriaceae bacterium]
MKQQHILKYGISICIMLVFTFTGIAQDTAETHTKTTDSSTIKKKYGLRLGVDISKPTRAFLDDTYSGIELMGDYRITENMYLAGEIGTEEKNTKNEYLNVSTQGSYFKAGIDYNLYKNWLDMDNMIYSGFRIGASTFNQTLNSYTVYTTNQYWQPQFSSNEAQKFSGLTALWTELLLGIKAEVLNNLYLGANIQFKLLLSQDQPNNFENLYIPGFNKTYDSGNIGIGFGYNISYLIPLYKKGK